MNNRVETILSLPLEQQRDLLTKVFQHYLIDDTNIITLSDQKQLSRLISYLFCHDEKVRENLIKEREKEMQINVQNIERIKLSSDALINQRKEIIQRSEEINPEDLIKNI